MKKIFTFLLVVSLTTSPAILFGQSCISIYDGFESGTLDTAWTQTGGHTWTVDTTAPAVGTYCLRQVGSSSHYNGLSRTTSAMQPDYISIRIKRTSNAEHCGYFVGGDANTPANNGIFFIYMYASSSSLRFYAGAGNEINHPTAVDTWYHIELQDFDYVNGHFDIYVDGVQLATDFPFRSPTSTAFEEFHMYNFTGGSTAYYDEVIVGHKAPVIDSSSVTNPICYGDSTGMIDLTVSGSITNGPISYLWSNADTTEDVNGLVGGNYTVTITDSIGCITVDSFMVYQPLSAISSSGAITDVGCNGDTTGSIDLSVTGGEPGPGYTYNWSTGDTTQDISNLGDGMYTVVITDSLGCNHYDTLTVVEPAVLSTSSVVTNDDGTTNGAIDLSVNGGTPGYTYLWDNSATTEDINSLTAGTYIVTVTDTNGCMVTDTIEVFSTAGTEENESQFKIWPNPFDEVINIQVISPGAGEVNLQMTDLSGKVIYTSLIPGGTTQLAVHLPNTLSQGIYLLQLSQGNKQYVVKLLKR